MSAVNRRFLFLAKLLMTIVNNFAKKRNLPFNQLIDVYTVLGPTSMHSECDQNLHATHWVHDMLEQSNTGLHARKYEAKSRYALHVRDFIANQKLGSKDFSRIYNRVMNKDKSTIQALKIDSSSISMAISPAEKAELLSMQFAKNSSLDEGGQNPPPCALRTGETVSPPSFTVKRVNKIISCLDSSKSSGPDGIPATVFKHVSPELSPVDPVQNLPEMSIHQWVSFLLKSCFSGTNPAKSIRLVSVFQLSPNYPSPESQ